MFCQIHRVSETSGIVSDHAAPILTDQVCPRATLTYTYLEVLLEQFWVCFQYVTLSNFHMSLSNGFIITGFRAKASVWEVTYFEIVFGEISKILPSFSIRFAVTLGNRFSVILHHQHQQLLHRDSSSAFQDL